MAKSIQTFITKFTDSLDEDKEYTKIEIQELLKGLTKPKVKRAKTAYQHYLSDDDVKEAFKEENPKVEFKERSGMMSAQWKALSEEDKKPYVDMNLKEKGETTTTKKTKVRSRAKTAYQFYMGDKEMRE